MEEDEDGWVDDEEADEEEVVGGSIGQRGRLRSREIDFLFSLHFAADPLSAHESVTESLAHRTLSKLIVWAEKLEADKWQTGPPQWQCLKATPNSTRGLPIGRSLRGRWNAGLRSSAGLRNGLFIGRFLFVYLIKMLEGFGAYHQLWVPPRCILKVAEIFCETFMHIFLHNLEKCKTGCSRHYKHTIEFSKCKSQLKQPHEADSSDCPIELSTSFAPSHSNSADQSVKQRQTLPRQHFSLPLSTSLNRPLLPFSSRPSRIWAPIVAGTPGPHRLSLLLSFSAFPHSIKTGRLIGHRSPSLLWSHNIVKQEQPSLRFLFAKPILLS
ncbi:hypothetical protein B0H10DRAFT_2381358 [Mycena sp. CBHHK59/15]|nr:hypothetical protein B0H10DRAFT_2381358 [Mycena sp. CBHHK59/15]